MVDNRALSLLQPFAEIIVRHGDIVIIVYARHHLQNVAILPQIVLLLMVKCREVTIAHPTAHWAEFPEMVLLVMFTVP